MLFYRFLSFSSISVLDSSINKSLVAPEPGNTSLIMTHALESAACYEDANLEF